VNGPLVALVFRHTELRIRIESELARLEQEREQLIAQRDRLLDGTWGKGAPPCEELPQLGECTASWPSLTVRGIAFPVEGGKTLREIPAAPGDPVGRELRTSDIAPDPREQGRETMRAIGEGMGKVFFDTLRTIATEAPGTVEHTPDTAAAVDALKQAAEADNETVEALRRCLDVGWRRVSDWRNQNPFNQGPAE
jgi:hypothetical protein